MTPARSDRTRTEAFVSLATLVATVALAILVDLMTLPEGAKLTREGGSIEVMSMLGYVVAIGIYLWRGPRPPFWPVPLTLLFMALREADADKRFTSEGMLSTKILVYDTPAWEKLLALGVWAVLPVTLIALIRGRLPGLLSGLRRLEPWSLCFAVGLLLTAFSKAIDGLARKLSPWGIDVSSAVDSGAGTIEELLELLIPILFIIAIFLRSAARDAQDDRFEAG